MSQNLKSWDYIIKKKNDVINIRFNFNVE